MIVELTPNAGEEGVAVRFFCSRRLETVMGYALHKSSAESAMRRTRGFQIVALQNMDRLLLKSMLGMLEPQLSAQWVESALTPTAIFADADHPEGFQVLSEARNRGICAVAISNRLLSSWPYLLRRPVETRDVLAVLNRIDADQLSAMASAQVSGVPISGPHQESAHLLTHATGLKNTRGALQSSHSELIRKAGNLYQYLCARAPRNIVDVRFAPGRSVMFNHRLGEYCSAISQSQLLQMAYQPVKETAHGDGQANAEWSIAKRMLPTGSIEDLTWQIAMQVSNGVALEGLSDERYLLTRLPRLSVPMMGAELSMAKLLTRSPTRVRDLARGADVSVAQAINFCNAAFVCSLLQNATAPRLGFAAMLSSVALKLS